MSPVNLTRVGSKVHWAPDGRSACGLARLPFWYPTDQPVTCGQCLRSARVAARTWVTDAVAGGDWDEAERWLEFIFGTESNA